MYDEAVTSPSRMSKEVSKRLTKLVAQALKTKDFLARFAEIQNAYPFEALCVAVQVLIASLTAGGARAGVSWYTSTPRPGITTALGRRLVHVP